MFNIQSKGFFRRKNRLVAPTKLEPADFYKVADRIGVTPFKARKIGFVAARKAAQIETVQTRWDGKETTNSARPGDWIVTNLSPAHEVIHDKTGHENTYVIRAETFPSLYDAELAAMSWRRAGFIALVQ